MPSDKPEKIKPIVSDRTMQFRDITAFFVGMSNVIYEAKTVNFDTPVYLDLFVTKSSTRSDPHPGKECAGSNGSLRPGLGLLRKDNRSICRTDYTGNDRKDSDDRFAGHKCRRRQHY